MGADPAVAKVRVYFSSLDVEKSLIKTFNLWSNNKGALAPILPPFCDPLWTPAADCSDLASFFYTPSQQQLPMHLPSSELEKDCDFIAFRYGRT